MPSIRSRQVSRWLLGLWHGAWAGWGLGVMTGVWLGEQSPGMLTGFTRMGLLVPMCILVAALPDLVMQIAKGVRRFNAAARPRFELR